jgi:hypothetical protein
MSCVRDAKLTSTSVEDGEFRLIFEVADLLAQGRLRKKEALGRTCEVQRRCDCFDVLEKTERKGI